MNYYLHKHKKEEITTTKDKIIFDIDKVNNNKDNGKIGDDNVSVYATDEAGNGVFSGFRGINGTGQNFISKGAVLDQSKKGLEEKSSLLDCLWGELYGSINIAEINDGSITPEHADYLRKKFLFK